MRIPNPSRLPLLLQRRSITPRLQTCPVYGLRYSSEVAAYERKLFRSVEKQDRFHLQYIKALEKDVIFSFKERDELALELSEGVVIDLEDKLNSFMELEVEKAGRSARLADERKFYFQTVLVKALETVKRERMTAVKRLAPSTTQAEITAIKTQNFRGSLKTAALNLSSLPRNEVFMVSGENGAGKSTLVEALSWCLFNRPLSPYLSNDDVLCKDAPEELFGRQAGVTLDFKDGYRITRVLSQPATGVSIELKVRGQDGNRLRVGEQQRVSPKHVPNRYLGIPPDTYAQICTFSESTESLGSVRQGQIEALDELFGMGAIEHCKAVIKNHIEGTDAKIMVCIGEQAHVRRMLEQIQQRIQETEKGLQETEEHLATQKKTIESFDTQKESLDARIKGLVDMESTLKAEISALDEKLQNVDQEIATHEKLLQQKSQETASALADKALLAITERDKVKISLNITKLRQDETVFQSEVDRLTKLITDTERSCARRRSDLSKLSAKLAFERGILTNHKHRLSSLKRELEGLRESESSTIKLLPAIEERVTKLTRTNTLAKWWKTQLSDKPDDRGEFITYCRAGYTTQFTRSLAPIVRALNPGSLANALFSLSPDMKLVPVGKKPLSLQNRSRGELMRTHLAMFLTILQLSRQRLRCHPGFVFIDDVYDCLDDKGAACLTLWLKEFARREGIRVFLMTEKSVKTPGHVIEVVREAVGVRYEHREYVYRERTQELEVSELKKPEPEDKNVSGLGKSSLPDGVPWTWGEGWKHK